MQENFIEAKELKGREVEGIPVEVQVRQPSGKVLCLQEVLAEARAGGVRSGAEGP